MMSDKKVTLVTGGAGGMGLAIVERLAHDGYQVHVVDRDATKLEEVVQQLRTQALDVHAHVLDLCDETATRALIDELPPLYALINNAGIFTERAFDEVSTQDFQLSFEVNLLAVATLTQASAKKMAAGSRIVNIASRAYLGAVNHAHYVSAKAAVVGYTRASALELIKRPIWVNAIAPGLVDTPILRALSPERMQRQLDLQPTGKAGQVEDIAQAVAFLIHPNTQNITGQVIMVDGGKSLGGAYT